MNTVDYVYAEKILKRNAKLKGYRYIAVKIDGEEEVIRQCATRLYDNAFLYEGNPQHNHPAIWSFGKKSQNCYGNLKASFPVATSPGKICSQCKESFDASDTDSDICKDCHDYNADRPHHSQVGYL